MVSLVAMWVSGDVGGVAMLVLLVVAMMWVMGGAVGGVAMMWVMSDAIDGVAMWVVPDGWCCW